MSGPNNFHELPVPHSSVAGRNHNDRGDLKPSLVAGKYRPAGAPQEPEVATVARFAARLIDRATGRAYSADELVRNDNTNLAIAEDPAATRQVLSVPQISAGAPVNESVTISGTLSPDVTGTLLRVAPDIDWGYKWTSDGQQNPTPTGPWVLFGYHSANGEWALHYYSDGDLTSTWLAQTTNLDPTAAVLVAEAGATGTPAIDWGVGGTEGYLGSMKVDKNYLYVVAEVDTTKPYWKKIALTAL
ncbi:MAG: hypothetical protein LLG20_22590 [Acidobacteriales bacterium]|nr:hypothetical protein [Terriglobales bacterium]